MSCIKKIALSDPLIDHVPNENFITEKCEILNINLLKVRKEELDFVARFNLKFKQRETFHALVCWFDCFFNACEPVVKLSTSPASMRTHWKQVVLYYPEPIDVFKNDVL